MTTNIFTNRTRAGHQRGASIIEALIAGLVLSFCMVALTGMQVALSRNADVAKQRTEATRLAQEKMEELRSFQGFTAIINAGTGRSAVTYDSVVSSVAPDAVTLVNTAFERRWTVVDEAKRKRVLVTVAWNDRANAPQTVTLQSTIAMADHKSLGVILTRHGGSNNGGGGGGGRNLNVPYPADDIGNGRSTWRWPGNNQWYVFDNTNANVLYRCDLTIAPTTADLATAACTSILAYIVAGYLSVDIPRNPTAIQDFNSQAGWTINGCGIRTSDRVNVAADNGTTAIDEGAPCFVDELVERQMDGTYLINNDCPYFSTGNTAPTGSEIADLRFYKCYAALVELANPNVPEWSGRMEFQTAPTSPQRICRYNNNLNRATGTYTDIDLSLNNENYYALASGNCETGQTPHQP